MSTKASPCLMFNDQLGPAVELYTSLFPDSKVVNLVRQGTNGPVLSAEFIVGGSPSSSTVKTRPSLTGIGTRW